MPTTYEQTKAGWDKAAENFANQAIHPAGLKGEEEYEESGKNDAQYVYREFYKYGESYHYWNGVHGPFSPHQYTIIDYGCGNGRVSKHLGDFKKIYAVDFSYNMLQQLPRNTNIEPVLSTFNKFSLPEPADYAFSISVMIHNNYESGKQIMQSIYDNLKPGGMALIQVPLYEIPHEATGWIDVGTWGMDQFKKTAEHIGYEVVELFENPGKFDYNAIGANHFKFQILQKPL